MARSMGGSRGGGGSRSSGRSMGGGSRGGSRSMGSSRSIRSGSSGPRRMGGSGSYGGSSYSSSRSHHSNHSYHSSHHHHGHHMPPPPRRRYYYSGGRRYYSRSSGGGCASLLAYLIVLGIIFIALFTSSMGSGSSSNPKLNRDKYTGSVDSSHGYYEDTCVEKFIDHTNQATLIAGFKEFYNKTGVFPFLYVVENTPSPSEYEGYDTYQDMVYEQLFDSEGNFLMVYIAQEDNWYYAAGYNIGEIVDETSLKVIDNKINSYYDTGDMAKAFGNGLRDASKNIMAKSNARVIGVVLVISVAAIIIVAMVIKWWKKKKEQDNKEQEDLEKILNTPLETFGSDVNDLAQKYD